ncbi:uncharacterized protein P884DRAFT_5797 [Thermothelomyces heterothallicus CBS 202.75]|uniref:uncharacterized protein n=1 Tax=Thermothelomyces heterothallicus CBS 202.75 TaxID=1149848 RepID=UPI003741FBE7
MRLSRLQYRWRDRVDSESIRPVYGRTYASSAVPPDHKSSSLFSTPQRGGSTPISCITDSRNRQV